MPQGARLSLSLSLSLSVSVLSVCRSVPLDIFQSVRIVRTANPKIRDARSSVDAGRFIKSACECR